jgi:hypothetical protein
MNADQNMPYFPSSRNLICFASLPFPRESDYSEFPGKSQLAACIDFLPVAVNVVTLYSDKLDTYQCYHKDSLNTIIKMCGMIRVKI